MDRALVALREERDVVKKQLFAVEAAIAALSGEPTKKKKFGRNKRVSSLLRKKLYKAAQEYQAAKVKEPLAGAAFKMTTNSYDALYSLSTPGFKALGHARDMLKDKRLKPLILRSKNKILDLTDPTVKKQYKYTDKEEGEVHRYYDEDIPGAPLKENTIFLYEPGRHQPPGSLKMGVAGIYLKNVIHEDIWRTALGDPAKGLPGFRAMSWEPPTRSETRPAKERQRGQKVEAAELQFGHTTRGKINKHGAHKVDEHNHAALGPLYKFMDLIFLIVLPGYWLHQSVPKTLAERKRIRASLKSPKDYGGALSRWKLFGTSFSSGALLRSCPAAIHQDANAGKEISNFTCLTSCGEDVKGGTFCLIEYGIKIAVQPGDLLICQTSREWHCNLGPVTGKEKYSIVAYYQPELGNEEHSINTGVAAETWEDRLDDWLFTAEEGEFFALGSGKTVVPWEEDELVKDEDEDS
jgi:hypothetical protein